MKEYKISFFKKGAFDNNIEKYLSLKELYVYLKSAELKKKTEVMFSYKDYQ